MHNIDEPALINLVFDHYHRALISSERAISFLKEFNFATPEIITGLHIGYADRTLGFKFPDGRTPKGSALRGALIRLGLFRPTGHELFRGCVIFPLMETNGAVKGGFGFRLKDFETAKRLVTVNWVTCIEASRESII